MASLSEQVAAALTVTAVRDRLSREAEDRMVEAIESWARTSPQRTGVRRFQRMIRAAFFAASRVATEHAERMTGVEGWKMDPLADDTEVLRRLVMDAERNVQAFLASERSEDDLRRLTFRLRLGAQAATRMGYTESLVRQAEVMESSGLQVTVLWRANFVNNVPCTTCAGLHGQEMTLPEYKRLARSQVFSRFPGPPAHPNCRCSLLVLVHSLETLGEEVSLEAPPAPAPQNMTSEEVKQIGTSLWRALIAALKRFLKFALGRGL